MSLSLPHGGKKQRPGVFSTDLKIVALILMFLDGAVETRSGKTVSVTHNENGNQQAILGNFKILS